MLLVVLVVGLGRAQLETSGEEASGEEEQVESGDDEEIEGIGSGDEDSASSAEGSGSGDEEEEEERTVTIVRSATYTMAPIGGASMELRLDMLEGKDNLHMICKWVQVKIC